MLTKKETEDRCGFEIPDGIWEYVPWGNRVVVKRIPPEEKYGSIFIPQTARKQIAGGVIVRLGEGVGQLNGLPGQAIVPQQFYQEGDLPIVKLDGLIGLTVTFNYFAGESIHASTEASLVSNTYDTEFVLIQAIDIWGHNEIKKGNGK